MTAMYVRIKPTNQREDFVTEGFVFHKAAGWYPVDESLAKVLARKLMSDRLHASPNPPVFDVVSKDEMETIARREFDAEQLAREEKAKPKMANLRAVGWAGPQVAPLSPSAGRFTDPLATAEAANRALLAEKLELDNAELRVENAARRARIAEHEAPPTSRT